MTVIITDADFPYSFSALVFIVHTNRVPTDKIPYVAASSISPTKLA